MQTCNRSKLRLGSGTTGPVDLGVDARFPRKSLGRIVVVKRYLCMPNCIPGKAGCTIQACASTSMRALCVSRGSICLPRGVHSSPHKIRITPSHQEFCVSDNMDDIQQGGGGGGRLQATTFKLTNFFISHSMTRTETVQPMAITLLIHAFPPPVASKLSTPASVSPAQLCKLDMGMSPPTCHCLPSVQTPIMSSVSLICSTRADTFQSAANRNWSSVLLAAT